MSFLFFLDSTTSPSEVSQGLDEFWFLTNPEHFNCFCHPKDERWQLLKKPWTDKEFLKGAKFAQVCICVKACITQYPHGLYV